MASCSPNRYNPSGYLDLTVLNDYAEYANRLCEFVLNTIVLDYVVRTSIRNVKHLIDPTDLTHRACMSLTNINLDTDFISYEKQMRRLCTSTKAMIYDMKTTRLTHPSWIVRFPLNFRRILQAYACNLRHLLKKIREVEGYVVKADLSGDILRYHAISAALTTVKYDLVTLYVTLRSGSLTAMKTSFLYPILSDTQRWLIYTYSQIKLILSSFPGSNVNRQIRGRSTSQPTKLSPRRLQRMDEDAQKTVAQSQIISSASETESMSASENA